MAQAACISQVRGAETETMSRRTLPAVTAQAAAGTDTVARTNAATRRESEGKGLTAEDEQEHGSNIAGTECPHHGTRSDNGCGEQNHRARHVSTADPTRSYANESSLIQN